MALPLVRLPSSPNPPSSLSIPSSYPLLNPPSCARIPCFPTRSAGVAIFLRRAPSALPALSEGTAIAKEGTAEGSAAARTRLIAQNIPWTCTADDIKALFAKHGDVVDVELSMHNSSRNRGLAFVTMATEEEALAALSGLNAYDMDGRVIKVEFARSVKKTPVEAAAPVPRYNVFVGNLTWRVRSRDLRELFNASGKNVLSAEVIFQSNPRRSAGYGFVSFSSKEDAEAAITALNGKKLMGRNIRLVLGKAQADYTEHELVMAEQSDNASNEVSTT